MEPIINHIKATTGTHLTYRDYHELGLRVSDVHLDADVATDTEAFEDLRDRTDRVENAYLAVWGDEQGGTLDPSTAREMRRVLRGEVAPDNADLPRPEISDFHKIDRHDPNPELTAAVRELIDEVASRMEHRPDPDDWRAFTPYPERDYDAMRENAREQAEVLYQRFLDGEPIDTDDLLIIQRTGLL